MKNETWTLKALPPDRQAIKSKWVFRIKKNSDGSLDKYKARLVAKGFTQVYGVDFQETYAPVAGISTIRCLVAWAVENQWIMEQYDINSAYLQSELSDEVYMEQPEGFVKSGSERLVCHLKRSIYGLKQSARRWNEKFDHVIKSKGMKRCKADACVYHITFQDGCRARIVLYVDDIFTFCENASARKQMRTLLEGSFDVRYLGPLRSCVGIDFVPVGNGMLLTQGNYVRKLVKRFHMEECKPTAMPADPTLRLTKAGYVKKDPSASQAESCNFPFRELIGALTYITTATRPDCAYAVNFLAQYNSCPTVDHWEAAKRILRYLKGTADYGIYYRPTGKPLTAFADADWSHSMDDRRSITGYAFYLAGAPVVYRSIRQPNVTLSTMESEYVALSECAREAIWLRELLSEIGVQHTNTRELLPTLIWSDSKSAISFSESYIEKTRSKHVSIRYYFLREQIEAKEVNLKYIPGYCNPADILTKPLNGVRHNQLVKSLGMQARLSP